MFEWYEKRMKHPCPFCGNVYTFMTVQMDLKKREKILEEYYVHLISAKVVCHGCGATVGASCHIKEMAVE